MTTHLELVQRMFQAIGQGDMATLERLLHEDLTYTLAGTSSFAGRTVGRSEVLALLRKMNLELTIGNSVCGMYVGPDGVVVHQTGEGAGYHDESLVLFKIDAGRITEAVEFLFDVPAFDDYAATTIDRAPV